MSSGSSLGSLTSTGSQGSQSSVAASLSDIYIDPCQRLSYELPAIDHSVLFQRVERLLKCSSDLPSSSAHPQLDHVTSRTAVSQAVTNSSSDAANNVGYLPTYEQHLERQKYHCTPVPTSQADPVDLTNSLRALDLGPFTNRLIASTSAGCRQPLTASDDIEYDRRLQAPLVTPTAGCSLGQSDASSGASGDDAALGEEVGRGTSRHVSSGSATESDSGICDASMQQ